MNFKDLISTFAHNLISLHHDIMWYIIIILSLVYWSLYKIVKEYSWGNFNKIEGFILMWKALYFDRYIKIKKVIYLLGKSNNLYLHYFLLVLKLNNKVYYK